jgi:hypothetical protein
MIDDRLLMGKDEGKTNGVCPGLPSKGAVPFLMMGYPRLVDDRTGGRRMLRWRRFATCIRVVFTYHRSATVVAPITGPSCWAVWHTLNPLLVAVARPRVSFTRVVIPTTKSTVLACRYSPATHHGLHTSSAGPYIRLRTSVYDWMLRVG